MDGHEVGARLTPSSPSSVKGKISLPMSCDPPSPGNPPKELVWIIFGATGHMGRSLTKNVLSSGDRVVAVGRVFVDSLASMQDWHSACVGTVCDVRSLESVTAIVQQTLATCGRIDVIANCSGYGVIAACEDQDEYDMRAQFETNFMGTVHIIQASLTYFREHNRGRYIIFSSTAGSLGVPGLGPYCASKYAVESMVEAMLYEIESFNIRATLVEPGLVRRDEPDWDTNTLPTWGHFFLKPSSEPYLHPTSPSLHATRMVTWLGDRQPTSVVKCAELVWQLGHCSYPPLRLILGSYALESIRDRLRSITEELEDWKHLNFPVPSDGPSRDTRDRREERAKDRDKGKEKQREQDDDDDDDLDDERRMDMC